MNKNQEDSLYKVRIIGDPVLRKVAEDVDDIDSEIVNMTEKMFATMYAEPGLGLAAPQIGVRKRLFVYDIGDGKKTIVNPVIEESDGEWSFQEGCLSVPGLFWDIIRPKTIYITGYDLDGNEVKIEADELLARLFQHEMDHLNGVMLIDHLDEKTRKKAMKKITKMKFDIVESGMSGNNNGSENDANGGLVLP